MASSRQYGVLGPLLSGAETRAFMGVEVIDGEPKPDRPVVVVWLPDDVTGDPARVTRLQRETAFVTQLKHPNIIRVFGLECFEEGWARVVAFVDGEPLHQILSKAREASRELEPRLAARIAVDVCEGVHYAHEEGQSRYAGRPIVHGGIRPDTLLVTFQGVSMVTGYGASVMAPTQHGVPIRSKFVYFAPEQIIGGKATASPTTDVYAIGAVLYELIAGKPPFAGADDPERAVLTGEPDIIEASGLAGRLGNIAVTALAKRGAERFESVQFMKEAILQALSDENVELASHADVATLVNELIPYNAPEREGRRSLLSSADDEDMITVLSRPVGAPEGVDAALFEASRPGPVSTMQATPLDPLGEEPQVRTAPPREENTIVEAHPVPREAMAGEPNTVLDQPAGLPSQEKEDDKTIADALPPFTGPAPSLLTEETVSAAPEPATPAPVAAAPAAPAAQLEPQPVTQAVAPVPVQPEAPVQPQVPAQPQVPVQPQVPPAYAAPPQPAPQPGQVYAAPAAQPGQQPAPQHYGTQPPVQAYGTQPPAEQYSAPPAQAQVPPTAYGTQPPQAYSAPPAQGQVPPTAYGTQPPQAYSSPPPQNGHPHLQSMHPALSHPPYVSGPQDGLLQNQPVKGLPQPAPRPVPSSPIREESSITAFNARTGDSSRTVLLMILAAAAALLIFIFAFPKEPPKGLDAPSERTRLPQEMVKEALSKTSDDESPEGTDDTAEKNAEASPEEKETAEQAARAAEAKVGKLRIDTDPAVDVYDGNDHLGRTPVVATLPAGRHKLRFTDRRTGINKYRTFRVEPEQDRRVKMTFGKSKLIVKAPSGATVSLNSRVIGKAPLEPVEIYEGRYLLRVTMDGMKWSEWFNAPPGQKIEYKVRLNQ